MWVPLPRDHALGEAPVALDRGADRLIHNVAPGGEADDCGGRRHQEELLQTPSAAPLGPVADLGAIRAIVQDVLASGRELLSEPEAKALLHAAGLPVVPTRVVAADPEAAAREAQALGFPVVIKILSHQISHKSDVGGVRLNLANADEVREAARAMLARVAAERPGAVVEGFTVQPMVKLRQATELIVGASVDPLFGPVILFGQGGTAVEVVADRALALPPLNGPLAQALIARTRVAKLLRGYRDQPAADMAAIERVLVAISQLLADVPEIAELDINPLVVNADGAVALDARVRVSAARPAGADNFAIRPYPVEQEERITHLCRLRHLDCANLAATAQDIGQNGAAVFHQGRNGLGRGGDAC